MTAITSQGTPVWTGGGKTSQPVFPTGYTVTAGDRAIIYSAINQNGSTTPVPSGWALCKNSPTNYQQAVTRILQPGDTLPQIIWSTGFTSVSVCVVLRGDLATDLTVADDNGNIRESTAVSAVPFPGLTVSAANDYILEFGTRNKTSAGDGATYTPPSGFTNLIPASVPAGSNIVATLSFQQQGAAASLSAASGSITKNDSNLHCQGYVLAIKTVAAPTAGFTVAPTVNATTALPSGAYTIGFAPNAAGTFYAVAVPVDAPAPSVAQVKAGQDSFGNAAQAAVSQAITGAVASSVVLGGSLGNALYDLYIVYHTTVDSAEFSLLAQYLLPDSGEQFIVVSGAPPAGADSILTSATPAAVVGDVMEVDLVTSPDSIALSVSGTGIPEFTGNGAPQTFTARIFQRATSIWSNRATFSINTAPPIFLGGLGPLQFNLNATLTPVALDGMWQSQYPGSTTITVTAVSGLPPGIFVSGNNLIGAGTAVGTYNVQLLGSDSGGNATTGNLTVIIGGVVIPNDLVGQTEAAGTAELNALLLAASPISVKSVQTPGTIIDVSPPPGTTVPALSTVLLSIAIPFPIPPGGGGNTGGTGTGGGASPPSPPIQSPGQIVARDASVQLTLSDLFHYVGNDVGLSNTQDLLTVTGTVMGQQRVLRRLITNPGDYLFQPDYGAGLLAKIGSPLDLPGLTALIQSQILLEDVVSPNPAPVVTVTQGADTTSIAVSIEYTDAPSGARQTLTFTASP